MFVCIEFGVLVVLDVNVYSFICDVIECFGGQGYMMILKGFFCIFEFLFCNDGCFFCLDIVEELFCFCFMLELCQFLVGQFNMLGWVVGDFLDMGEYDWLFGGFVVLGDSYFF